MALASGSRVGPYEVIAILGEGGMGKVWRARHSALISDFDVTPDGNRSLIVKVADTGAASARLDVVLNWAEALKRLVPAAN